MRLRTPAWHLKAIALATLTCASSAYAGPIVTTLHDTTPAAAMALVETLLGPSSGLSVVAGSAQYTGAATASGTFTNGGTDPITGVGIDSGVVLTTGDARAIGSSAAFPDDWANKTGTFTSGVLNSLTRNTSAGNSLFSSLTPFATANASILSFQFVPQYSTLTMSFVFASEDYNELVNSGFPTDVFGIFVNDINYALVPGTDLAISASTINCGGPTSGMANGAGASNCDLYRDNAPFFGSIDSEMNGFTMLLTLAMPVYAGEVNNISIGIANVLDTVGDSALLLRAGSVSAVPEPSQWALLLSGLAACALVTRRRRA